MNLSLDSKVALITGGSRGIGAATVRLFAASGAKVLFNYQSAKAPADALVRECGPANCRAVQADLSTAESAAALVNATVAAFGRLDILVANHGIWPAEDIAIENMSTDHWRRTIAVNVESVFGLIKHSVAQMKKQNPAAKSAAKSSAGPALPDKGLPDKELPGKRLPGSGPEPAAGHIVLISSTSGQRGEAFHCDYSATKGALISMTKTLSSELARDGIRTNCVAPGWVDTDMSVDALTDPKTRDKIFSGIPLGRVGTPEEIAAPILFLCTPQAGFITGEVFNVNGGAVLVG